MGKMNGKLLLAAGLILWVFAARLLTGCAAAKEEQKKVRDLEFTVVGEENLPEELKNLIAGKRQAEFKLTYSNDQGLFIVVGYGEQPSGGYSISVEELYLTDNAIVIDTELLGPEKNEEAGVEKTYPFVAVQTELLENPVIFR